ncbi:hypothetical protein Dimus_018433 [Dionaea muscipula]
MTVTSSEEEYDGLRGEEDGMLISSTVPDLSPISEDESNQGGSSSSILGSPTLSTVATVMFCQDSIDAGGHASVSSLLPSLPIADVREDAGIGEPKDAAAPTTMVELPCPVSDGCPVVCAGIRQEGAEGDGVKGVAVLPIATVSSPCFSLPDFCASTVCGKVAVGEGLEAVDGSVVVAQGRADPFFSGGERPVVAVPVVIGGGILNGAVQTSEFSKSGAESLLPRLSDDVGIYGGGLVSEEGRVLPVARGALRSQPTDGLRQPLSSPVEPVSVVAGGVSQDGRSGGRSRFPIVSFMVGRREPSQRRVVEDCHDSRSPGPRHPVMFRGSPSPPTTFHRRPAPSPGSRPRHLRSPSPLMRSSVDPDEVSSSEEGDVDSMERTAMASEDEDDGLRGMEAGLLIASFGPDLRPISKEDSIEGGSSSSMSGSPILSPAAAVRFCQEAIEAGGQALVSSQLLSTVIAGGREAFGVGDSLGVDTPMTMVSSLVPSVLGAVVPTSMVSVPCPVYGDGQDREFEGGERDAPVADAVLSPVGAAVMLPVRSLPSTMSVGAARVTVHDAGSGDGERADEGDAVAVVEGDPDSCVGMTVISPVFGDAQILPEAYDASKCKRTKFVSLPHYPLLSTDSNCVGQGGDGMVSEEGQVSLGAMEAMRPQPADGLR